MRTSFRATPRASCLNRRELLDACFGKSVPGWKLAREVSEPSTDTQAYVYQPDVGGRCVLAFPPTKGIEDWIRNVQVSKVSFDSRGRSIWKTRIHSGWFNAWESIRHEVVRAIWPSAGLVSHVTGYSLGAALALIAAWDLGRGMSFSVTTFAGPRTGNRGFISEVQSLVSVHRVVYGNDLVARIPPWFFGYRHAGTKVRIGDRVWTPWGDPMDHLPERYREALDAS
jgi:hypothetical protein